MGQGGRQKDGDPEAVLCLDLRSPSVRRASGFLSQDLREDHREVQKGVGFPWAQYCREQMKMH